MANTEKKQKQAKTPKAKKEPKLRTRYIGAIEIGDRKFETNEFFKNEKAALRAALDKAVEYGYIKAVAINVKVKTIEERVTA